MAIIVPSDYLFRLKLELDLILSNRQAADIVKMRTVMLFWEKPKFRRFTSAIIDLMMRRKLPPTAKP